MKYNFYIRTNLKTLKRKNNGGMFNKFTLNIFRKIVPILSLLDLFLNFPINFEREREFVSESERTR